MSQVGFFFNGWEPLIRIVVVGSLAYFSLVLLLRISGSRSLAQLNAFDFLITVALGASFGRILTARQVALAEALTAFGLLLALQYGVSWYQTRSRKFSRLVTAPPTLLFYQGQFLTEEMQRNRLTENEVCAIALRAGNGSMKEIGAIVLEANGKFGIVKKAQPEELPLVEEVRKGFSGER